jgi:hypothetical protein
MMPSVFLAALGIVIGLPVTLGIVSDLYKRRLAFKEREMELLSRQTAEKTAQYIAHNERLEQRVRVLERLVTVSGTDLALRIEALRETEVH